MKRLLFVLFAALAALVFTQTRVESKPDGRQWVYFVRGEHYTRPDGSDAIRVRFETKAWVNPKDAKDMKRAGDAAEIALDAYGPESIALSPRFQAKLHPSCPQYQDAGLMRVSPPVEDSAPPCSYGDPQCPTWKTKDLYDCWGPAINCQAK